MKILAPVVLVAFLLTPVAAAAQVSTAELNGRVTDSSGGVLPGVSVQLPADSDEMQVLAKVDYQSGTKHAFFGRYFVTRFTQDPGYGGGSDSVLLTNAKGADMSSHSTTAGATTVFSASVVNALRFAVNKGTVDVFQTPFFQPSDLGIKLYAYVPGYMTINVNPGGFQLYGQLKQLFEKEGPQ